MSDHRPGTPARGNSPTPEEFAHWRLTHPPMMGAEEPPPEPPAPEPPAPGENWEQRYKDTQAAYTASQQELAAANKIIGGEDPDALKQVLDAYGLTLDNEDPPDPVEPADQGTPAADPRLDELVQWRQQQEAQQQQAQVQAEWAGWTEHVKGKATEKGVDLTEHEVKALKLDSADKDGYPVAPAQAEQALEQYLTFREQWIAEQVAAARKRPRVPTVPPGGTPPSEKKWSQMTDQEAERLMVERVQAASTTS